ncbi:hypothetical protein [Nocardia cyriacigeorgica]|uniref:hypothetical protein n=1 Tax=Nocardia cyriacigeorgica TaxID=135487 RepID=UPI0024574110|nr:hypothetical protein [Nocardia cyriacigeorgica]
MSTRPRDYPPHIARPGAGLVGPLVRFRGQPVAVSSSPPRDTRDPRYLACTDHRLACDCREAEQNEQLTEYRIELRQLRDLFDALTESHPTRVEVDGVRRADLECHCPLCVFGRQARLDSYSDVRSISTKGHYL